MKKKILIFPLTVLVLSAVCIFALFYFNPDFLNWGPSNKVTLHLTNGSVISGELIETLPDKVIIFWKNGEVAFKKDEISSIEYGKSVKEAEGLLFPEEKTEWAYKGDMVVQLTNLTVLDAEVAAVTPENITIQYAVDGGGSIEQDIKRSRVEALLFKPIDNKPSRKIEKRLKQQFPEMQFHEEGIFTIVTDSTSDWVKKYKKALNDHLTDFYFTYFSLLEDKRPATQQYVIVFDSFADYNDYAIRTGCRDGLQPAILSPLTRSCIYPMPWARRSRN